MGNIFPPNKELHETYDLKGSTAGRFVTAEQHKQNPNAVLKDVNFLENKQRIKFGPLKQKQLLMQLREDAGFLARMNIMDYSLLLGIHDVQRGNAENLRPSLTPTVDLSTPRKSRSSRSLASAVAARRSLTPSGTGEAPQTAPQLHAAPTPDSTISSESLLIERCPSVSQSYPEQIGLRATNEDDSPADLIYYMGIIDILTPYNGLKRLESFFVGMKYDSVCFFNPLYFVSLMLQLEANICGSTEEVRHSFRAVYGTGMSSFGP